MSRSEPHWTIGELGELAARALAVDYPGQSNGQVRDVPDRRTIRYYTTLGLLDRPAEMRGRTALYGRRHLLQLVAIKRLQAAGRSLAEVQQQLLGLSTAALHQVARLPLRELEALEAASSGSAESEEPGPERPPGPFWSTLPAPLPAAPVESLQKVALTGEAALLLTTAEPLTADTVEAIRVAAEPLLQLLETRRLIRPRHEKRGS